MKLLIGKKALFGPGGGMGGPRQPISLLLGLIFLAFGVIPMLNSFGVIGFTIPIVPTGILLWAIALVGGVVLLWDALSEKMAVAGIGIESQMRMANIIVALVLLAIGIIPILNNFGVIGFNLPEFADIIRHSLFIIVGVLLLYGGTKSM